VESYNFNYKTIIIHELLNELSFWCHQVRISHVIVNILLKHHWKNAVGVLPAVVKPMHVTNLSIVACTYLNGILTT